MDHAELLLSLPSVGGGEILCPPTPRPAQPQVPPVTRVPVSPPPVLTDLHRLHHRLCEPLQDHRRPVLTGRHGALQQVPPGRAAPARLRHRQRVLPLPVEAPRQPVRPHQVTQPAATTATEAAY